MENDIQLNEKMAALDKREADLSRREASLTKALDKNKGRWRDNLYERITVPIKVMDVIIGVTVVALVVCVIIGIVL